MRACHVCEAHVNTAEGVTARQALPLSELFGRRAAETNAFEYYEAKWGLDGCKIPPRRLPWSEPLVPDSSSVSRAQA